MKRISQAEREMLWSDTGPYSEAQIIINHRILDDDVSRVMIEVEGHINPTTFRLVKKSKKMFFDNPFITQLLKTARYRGKEYGYHISTGSEEFIDAGSIQRAEAKVEYMKEAIIRMHEFVMKYYDLRS